MVNRQKVEEGVRLLLEGLGENLKREGLLETPSRIARMYEEIFGGTEEDPKDHLKKTFHLPNNELIVEKDIFFHSMCEHHMKIGRAHV